MYRIIMLHWEQCIARTWSSGIPCVRNSHRFGNCRSFSSSGHSLICVRLRLILFNLLNDEIDSSMGSIVSIGLSSRTRFSKFGKACPSLITSRQSDMWLPLKCKEMTEGNLRLRQRATCWKSFRLRWSSSRLQQYKMSQGWRSAVRVKDCNNITTSAMIRINKFSWLYKLVLLRQVSYEINVHLSSSYTIIIHATPTTNCTRST